MDERSERSAEVETRCVHVETVGAPVATLTFDLRRVDASSTGAVRDAASAPLYPHTDTQSPHLSGASSLRHSTAADAQWPSHRICADVFSLTRLSSPTNRCVLGGDKRRRDGSTRSGRWPMGGGRDGCVRKDGAEWPIDAVKTTFAGRQRRPMRLRRPARGRIHSSNRPHVAPRAIDAVERLIVVRQRWMPRKRSEHGMPNRTTATPAISRVISDDRRRSFNLFAFPIHVCD
jgi:hypothetical protein